MKITCTACNKLIGIQRPLSDDSVTSVLCPECFQKQIDEVARFQALPKPGETIDITLGNGIKGFLTVAGIDTEKLSLWDLAVSGKKVFCASDRRESFQNYLKMIDSEEVKVTFMFSTSVIGIPLNSRKKKKQAIKEINSKLVDYNCTLTVPRYYALKMFDNIAEKQEQIVNVLAEGVARSWLDKDAT